MCDNFYYVVCALPTVTLERLALSCVLDDTGHDVTTLGTEMTSVFRNPTTSKLHLDVLFTDMCYLAESSAVDITPEEIMRDILMLINDINYRYQRITIRDAILVEIYLDVPNIVTFKYSLPRRINEGR